MMDPAIEFIHTKHIDSFQKLFFLLFLYWHPNIHGTSQELGARLYLGNTQLTEKILADLQRAGLVDKVENDYKLHIEDDVSRDLGRLAQAFENPLTRQQLLDQVRHH